MFSPGIVADELQGYVGGSHLFGELVPANRVACRFSVSYQVVNEIDRVTTGYRYTFVHPSGCLIARKVIEILVAK